MTATLMIVWDYDTAIGQVNASYPYKFDEAKLFQEIDHVDQILDLGDRFGVQMTFACVGFAAEPGVFPYHVPEQIQRIYQAGHEIASHSWKHEWFPFLKKDQIVKSLERSKLALETCIQQPGCVTGFVPPFSRPMSWISRGGFSLGDRAWGPCYPGSDLGSLLKIVHQAGYQWCRVFHRSLWQRLQRESHPGLQINWNTYHHVECIPQHYTGFDPQAQLILNKAIQENAAVVIIGHPSGLSREREENIEHLKIFIQHAANKQREGTLEVTSVTSYLQTRRNQHGSST